MPGSAHTRRLEMALGALVAVGVAVAGIYDFSAGEAPSGLFGFDGDTGLPLFLLGCLAAVVLTVLLARHEDEGRPDNLRRALAVVCLTGPALADPTYGSLMMAIPLLDIRRRDPEPVRSILTIGILVIVAALVLIEDTRRSTTEFEAMMTLAIGFVAVGLLGDALRSLDRGLVIERRLARLAERNELAEELHDSLGHHLLATSVQLRKAAAVRSHDREAADLAVDHATAAVSEAIAETRLIVDSSRGDAPFLVEPSIHDLAKRIMPAGTTMDIQIDGDHDELGPSTRVAVFRVVQEALTNLVRHADATEAAVRSTASPEAVTVEIIDNGNGFDLDQAGGSGGLSNMRRRVEELGGVFRIDSTVGRTAVVATLPR